MFEEDAVVDTDVVEVTGGSSSGLGTYDYSPGIVVPDKAVMDVYIRDVRHGIYNETDLECDVVVVVAKEAVRDLYILAAADIQSVSVELPAYRIDAVYTDVVDVANYYIPTGTVDKGDVLEGKIDGSGRFFAYVDQEISPAVLVVSPMLHFLTGEDTVAHYSNIRAGSNDVTVDDCPIIDEESLPLRKIDSSGVVEAGAEIMDTGIVC